MCTTGQGCGPRDLDLATQKGLHNYGMTLAHFVPFVPTVSQPSADSTQLEVIIAIFFIAQL